ncbi:MAG: murein biosynthesis integral membrane protein MurJ [Gammaproteobacteria bacterium CG_4_10_14_0_8_um_filter_38_16]|nr:MAG: murein biosynthesis integral membrane protein MurJ [Gammaproteobacteria bacterium CG_4_10_14_0_8_um_filter_38_16]PJA04331.1 MAG: murein biosynthesis integral membrane protein MurJ [Gammaproteobacteria bacterium CG_4_10_14_0_2_um_filter_38_22]PJB10085.1 MAG: murein biosynthesis integral membrane protein MurJ [Gammaproteobacteria bacterium CG_4_9_14_3_um_filter_38_9]
MSQKLVRSTSVVAFFTFLSRIMGFVRDIILASIFGAGGLFDAFVVAFRLPNFLRRLFGEGAFAQAFVPILAEQRTTQSHAEVQLFVNHVAGTLTFIVSCVVVVAEIFAPILIMIFAPGFMHDIARFHVAEHMIRIMFPYLLLIVLTAFAGAILNTCGFFAAPAFTPVLLNIALISVALLWAPHAAKPIYVLAWGVIFGGLAQMLIQIPFLKHIRLMPRFKLGFRDPGVVRVMKRMLPALFGVSVAQISLLVDNMFASFLPRGSISWLYYSDRLIYFPLGIIGVALATVVMPYLSKNHAEKDEKIFSSTLDWALRCTLFIGVPCAVGLFILAGPILSTLIHYGKFNSVDVIMTAKSLSAFAVGLPAFMLIKILASAFYARQNIRTPVKVAAIALVVNLIFNGILIFPLKHAGLALSTSISSTLNAGLLWFLLMRSGIFMPSRQWQKTIAQLLIANGAMACVIYLLAGSLSPWLTWPILTRVGHLLWVLVSGMGCYFLLLGVMGVRIRHFRSPN